MAKRKNSYKHRSSAVNAAKAIFGDMWDVHCCLCEQGDGRWCVSGSTSRDCDRIDFYFGAE